MDMLIWIVFAVGLTLGFSIGFWRGVVYGRTPRVIVGYDPEAYKIAERKIRQNEMIQDLRERVSSLEVKSMTTGK